MNSARLQGARSTYEYQLYFYKSNEQTKSEIKKTIRFVITSKRITYLGISLSKEVQNVHSENYKILFTKIKEDLKKWKDIPRLWTRRVDIVKMAILPKLIYQFKTIHIRIPAVFFAGLYEPILNFMWKVKGPAIAKTILNKKNKVRGLKFPNFLQIYSNEEDSV